MMTFQEVVEMNVFFWIVDLIIPVTMMVMGTVFKKHPPKEINSVYGYRTSRSMASKEAWDYAHQLAGKVWMRIGVILLAFVVVEKLVVPVDPARLSIMNAGIGVAALIIPIPFIESQLKRKFDK